jgi:hypothetical protein
MPLGTGGLVYRGVSPEDMLDLTTSAASMA